MSIDQIIADHIEQVRLLWVSLGLIFVGILFWNGTGSKRLNWSLFFSGLWVLLSLIATHTLIEKSGFWSFPRAPFGGSFISYDLLFLWVIIWGLAAPLIWKGRKLLLSTGILLALDLCLMPILSKAGLFELGDRWWIGELILLLLVFVPAQLWCRFFYENKRTGLRTVFQVACVVIIYFEAIPSISELYFQSDMALSDTAIALSLQLAFILALPGLIACRDLYITGNGTPFPFDETKNLVQTGVYGYIRNPIQWSLTLIFVPIAIMNNGLWLLIGIPISVFYTLGLSNPQEGASMLSRFGKDWSDYKSRTPAWFFIWKPKDLPIATVYFKKDCSYCQALRGWLERKNPVSLRFEHAHDYKKSTLLQMRLVDDLGRSFDSIEALAMCLERINLIYASLGWFMRLPIILPLFQLIADVLGMKDDKSCETPDDKPKEIAQP